jgi:hypothetical protein
MRNFKLRLLSKRGGNSHGGQLEFVGYSKSPSIYLRKAPLVLELRSPKGKWRSETDRTKELLFDTRIVRDEEG